MTSYDENTDFIEVCLKSGPGLSHSFCFEGFPPSEIFSLLLLYSSSRRCRPPPLPLSCPGRLEFDTPVARDAADAT